MAVEEITKKEQIINFAQNDPFLKISEIARHVQTTPRYVRTILSEANISLMKLRERYARNMEKRLLVKEAAPQRITLSMKDKEAKFSLGPLSWQELRIEEDYLHRRKPREVLIHLSQEGLLGQEEPFYWLEAQAYLELDLLEKYIDKANSLPDLLPLCGCEKIQYSSNTISLLKEEAERDLLQLQRDILWNEYVIGRERHRFDLATVELVIPDEVLLAPWEI